MKYFFKQVKVILIFLIFGFLISFSFAKETDYLEYADIPGTDTITFNGEKNGINYEVWINTGEIDYVTGDDGKIHTCFPIIGTGYTDKLGEVYFSYQRAGSYICSDRKLRGVFKLSAGGRGHFEDLDDNPPQWKCFLDKYSIEDFYYHNGNGDDTGTGQARIDDVGFSNWNSAKTAYNISKALANTKVQTILTNANNKLANNYDTGLLTLIFSYPTTNGDEVLKNVSFKSIQFISGANSDILINGQTGAAFVYNGNLTTNDNGIITGFVRFLRPGKNLEYKLKVSLDSNSYIVLTGKFLTTILPPFEVNPIINGVEVSNKSLIGRKNEIKLTISPDSHISNFSSNFSQGLLNLSSYTNYFQVITGEKIALDGNYYPLQINYNPDYFYANDSLSLNYYFSGAYSFEDVDGNKIEINNFTGYTENGYLYKDGQVYSVYAVKDTDIVPADTYSKFIYKVKFLDKNGYPVNHLSFSLSLTDINKAFNLNLDPNNYNTGYFISIDTGLADINGIYKINIVSYKPTNSALLSGFVKNLYYNGHYPVSNSDKPIKLNNINFSNIVNLILEDKVLPINKQTTININFASNNSNASNLYFKLTGNIYGNGNFGFKEGKTLEHNGEVNQDFNVYITGDTEPDEVIYSGYLKYDFTGSKGIKTVYVNYAKIYNKFIFIGGGNLFIVGNVVSDKKIIGGKSYISTLMNPIIFKNKLKSYFYKNIIMGNSIIKVFSNKDIDLGTLTGSLYIYKCSSPENIISLYGAYSHKIKLFFLNCSININGNITSNNEKTQLDIFAFGNKNIDINSDNGWIIPGNIYIGPSVDTIQANLIADGSIITYKDTPFSLNADYIFFGRGDITALKRQLFIQGKVFSKNTIGGGNLSPSNTYMIIGGKKIPYDFSSFGGSTASEISKAYDIQFRRSNFVKEDGSYDTGDLSPVIYSKYHCSGDANTDNKICSSTIVIQDSNLFK